MSVSADAIVTELLLQFRTMGLDQVTAARAALRDLGAAADVPTWEKAAGGISMMSMAIGGLAAVTGGLAVDAAIKFQQEMELIHTQAGATQAEVVSMSQALLGLTADVATGPEALAQSLYHVESAGFRGAEALNIVQAAAEGARVGNANLEATTQAMIAVTASHIAGVKNEIDAMAQLNAIVGSGDTRMEGLVQAMASGILPMAHNVGLSLLDVGAAIATITDNATPAIDVATRLRMTLTMMAAPVPKAVAALASIGITGTQLAEDMRKPNGLLVAIGDLKTHLEDSGKSAVEQEQVIAAAFGGGRTSAIIQTLLAEFDRLKSKYPEISQQAQKFAEEFAATQQTTAYQVDQLRANIETVAVIMGTALLPAVNDIIHAVEPAVMGFEHWSAANQDLVRDMMLGAVALGAFGLALKGTLVGYNLAASAAAAYQSILKLLAGDEAAAGEATAAAGAAAAAARPNWALLNETLAQLAATLPVVAEEEVAVGAAAAAAAPEVSILAAGLGEMRATAGGLLVPLRAMPAELEATGAAAVTAGEEVAGAEAAAGGFSALLAAWPVVVAAAVVALDVLAYQHVPAVREAVSGLSDTLSTDFRGAVYETNDALSSLGDFLSTVGERLDQIGPKLDTSKGKTESWIETMGRVNPLTAPLFQLNDALHQIADSHDKAAAAAQRQADQEKNLAAVAQSGAAMVGAGAGGIPQVATNAAAQDYSQTVSNEKKVYNTDLAALADQIVAGSQQLQGFVAQTASAQQSLQRLTDAQVEGALRANLASGQATSAVTQFVDSLKSKATQAIDLAAVAMVRGSGSVQQLTAAAITAARTQVQYEGATRSVTEAVQRAVPGFAQLTKATEDYATKINTTATQAMNAYVQAVMTGKGNIDQLREAAVEAALKQKQFATLQTQLMGEVSKSVGGLDPALTHMKAGTQAAADGAQKFSDALDKAATRTVTDLAVALMTGKGNVDKLSAAAVKVAISHGQLADFIDQSKLRIAKSAGDWAAVLDLTRQQMQHNLDAAQGKYAADRQAGNTAALPGDEKQIDEAKNRLADFNKEIDKSTTSTKKVKDSFDQLATAANDRAKTAIDKLALALMHGGNSAEEMQRLVTAARDAVQQTKDFAYWLKVANDESGNGKKKKPKSPADELSQEKSKAQKDYDNAVAENVKDIELHGHATAADAEALKVTKARLDGLNATINQVEGTTKKTFDTFSQSIQTGAKNALDNLTLAIFNGTGGLAQLTEKAVAAARRQQLLTDAQTDAQLRVALAAGDVSSALKLLQQKIDAVTNDMAGLLLKGTAQDPIGTPQNRHTRQLGSLDGLPDTGGTTRWAADIAKLTGLYEQQYAIQAALTQAQEAAAIATGHFGDAVKIVSQKAQQDMADGTGEMVTALLGLGGTVEEARSKIKTAADENEALNLAQMQAKREETQAEIQAALAAGDFATAAKLQSQQMQSDLKDAGDSLVAAIFNGAGADTVAGLAASYQTAKDASDRWTASQLQADMMTGQFAEALKLTTDRLNSDYDNALSRVTLDILNHGQATRADIDAAIAARQAKDAETQATWDATYATSSAAEQSKMLADRFSHLVSEANQQQSSQDRIDQAGLQVLTDESKIAVDRIDATTKAVQDQTSVLQAVAALVAASNKGQLDAISDQSGIIKSRGDISVAQWNIDHALILQDRLKAEAALKVAQDQLRVAVDTAALHQIEAHWAQVTAADQVAIAMAKTNADRVNAAAQLQVDLDKLQVSQDQVKLAEDQTKLDGDMLVIQNDILSSISGVDAYGEQIRSDLAAIGADHGKIAADQLTLQTDTAAQAQQAAALQLQVARDEQQLSVDQAAAAAGSNTAQIRIAEDNNQLARDQVSEQQLTNALQNQSNSLLQKQLEAERQYNVDLLAAIAMLKRGASRNWIGGQDAFQGWLNNLNAEGIANGG